MIKQNTQTTPVKALETIGWRSILDLGMNVDRNRPVENEPASSQSFEVLP